MTVEELITILESFNPDTPVYVAIQKEQLYIYDPIVEVGQAVDDEGTYPACFINSEHFEIKASLN